MASSNTPSSCHVVHSDADFIPLPAKAVLYRGITWTRSTLIRLYQAGKIKSAGLRLTGAVKKRRMILRESLDSFIQSQLIETA